MTKVCQLFKSSLTLVLLLGIFEVNGHGRLLWPPARGTIFRHDRQFGKFNPPPNYNDNELNCGGRDTQHSANGGKCGECGDNFVTPRPRPNESGGIYDKQIIVASYKAGEVIDVHAQLTANHLGYMEFRMCEHNNPGIPEEQACLDKHLLEIVQSGGKPAQTREPVLENKMEYHLKLKLPEGVTCSQCIIQWHYVAGNNWGVCDDGSGGRNGCGPQETFRGCADIEIN